MKTSGLFLLLIFWLGAVFAEEFPYDLYDSVSINELIKSENEATEKEGIPVNRRRLWLPGVRKSSVVEYTGKSCQLLETHRAFLDDVHKSMPSVSKEGLALYTKEILVKEGRQEIWMLIQGSVFPFLEKELVPGDKFKVYYYWFGAFGNDYVFAINEFSSKSQ